MVSMANITVSWQRFREQIRIIWIQDRWVALLFIAGIVLNLVAYALIGFGADTSGNTVILHYSIYFGIDLVGPWYQLYSVPLIGTFIWLLNGMILTSLYRRDQLFGYALAGTTIVCELLLTITAALLLWVNG